MQTLARLAVTVALALSFLPLACAQEPAPSSAPSNSVATPASKTQAHSATKRSRRRRTHRANPSAQRTRTSTTPAPTLKTRSATTPAAVSEPLNPKAQREARKAQQRRDKDSARNTRAAAKATKKSDQAILAARSYGAMSVPKNQMVLKH